MLSRKMKRNTYEFKIQKNIPSKFQCKLRFKVRNAKLIYFEVQIIKINISLDFFIAFICDIFYCNYE